MKIITTTVLLAILSLISCSPKTAPTTADKNGGSAAADLKNINWEAYDQNSVVAQNEITAGNLQGLWKAYEGAFVFGGSVNTMNLTQPIIVEFKDGAYRRSVTDGFHAFTIKANVITGTDKEAPGTGIINQVTANVLTISWKVGANYTRYYYKK